MFHRMKSEAPQPQKPAQPAVQPPAAQQNNPQAASQSDAEKFAEYKQQQNPAAEQNRAQQPRPQVPQQKPQPAPQSSQPQPTKPQTTQSQPIQSQPNQEDAKAMTNQTQNNPTPASGEDISAPRALDLPVSPYQRPGQAPVRSGAGYPGAAYPTASAYPVRTGAAGAVTTASGDRRLTIGRGISISGEIESCDHIVVEGTVEAALKGASVLEIAEQGIFYGTVEIEEATVAGRFEGDITVHGRLTIRSTGVITGSISYKELEVEAGAVIDGTLTPAGSEARNKQGKGNKKDKKENAANNDDGLFSTKAAAE